MNYIQPTPESDAMRFRKPALDFSNTIPHWSAEAEFSHIFNASSTYIPHLEKFLTRVMLLAKAKLPTDSASTPRLREDVAMFIRQEGAHTALHESFNAMLVRNGYGEIVAFEEEIKADYKRLLQTKSLQFLCAYCEGFETVGPIAAYAWLDQMEDMLQGSDKNVVNLWKWHLMEEFEHRSVCYEMYHTLFGGYFYRVYGLIYQLVHLQRYSNRVAAYLLKQDRTGMSDVSIKASKKRVKQTQRKLMRLTLPRLLRAMLPSYNPLKLEEPKMYRQYMAELENGLT